MSNYSIYLFEKSPIISADIAQVLRSRNYYVKEIDQQEQLSFNYNEIYYSTILITNSCFLSELMKSDSLEFKVSFKLIILSSLRNKTIYQSIPKGIAYQILHKPITNHQLLKTIEDSKM